MPTTVPTRPALAVTAPVSIVVEHLVYRDEPVTHHGGGYVAPGRRVIEGTWLYPSPETCHDDRPDGIWIGLPDQPETQALVCRSCGLDCT